MPAPCTKWRAGGYFGAMNERAPLSPQRRRFGLWAAAAAVGLVAGGCARDVPPAPSHGAGPAAPPPDADPWRQRLWALERSSGGRLGVAALDLQTGARLAWRADERFPMCSTFKLPLAAFVLQRVDQGHERLDRLLRIDAGALVAHSPVTERHTGEAGITVAELARAAVTLSDNTAANVLLRELGGPAAFTAFERSLGDATSRLDRYEPELNDTTPPADERDTTTPAGMLAGLQQAVLGEALSPASRDLLVRWMRETTTGERRLREPVPPDWRPGDKTGTGAPGTANDVAVFWPPGRQPVLVTAYLTQATLPGEGCEAVLADVGRLVVSWVRDAKQPPPP